MIYFMMTMTHTQPYEHIYANATPMSTFEGLSRQILKFRSHHNHLTINRDVA